MWKKLPDSLVAGIISGFISLGVSYFLLTSCRLLVVSYYQNTYLFQAPKVFLFSVFFNVLFFRFMMVKWEKENFGKGILLATLALCLVYFYYFFRYHQTIFGL